MSAMKGISPAQAEQRAALQRLRAYQHADDDDVEFHRLLFDALRHDEDPDPTDEDLALGIISFRGYKERDITGSPLHFAAWRLSDKHPRGLVAKIFPRLLTRFPQSLNSRLLRAATSPAYDAPEAGGLLRASSISSRRSALSAPKDGGPGSPPQLLSPRDPPPAAPVAPAPAKGCSIVEVMRRSDAKLGIGLSASTASVGHIVVTEIETAGLIPDWNARHAKCPVVEGSRIVEVNGLRGESSQMLHEIQRSGSSKLRLKVVPPCISCESGSEPPQETGDPFLGYCYYKAYEKDGMVSAIHLAVASGNQEVYLYLLQDDPWQARAPAYHDYEPHFEPIHDAVWFGRAQAVQDLLAWEADVNAPNRRALTPLHLASKLGHVNIASVLLAQSADASARNEPEGETPLELAAKDGVFDRSELHLLARSLDADLALVARSSAEGAVAMLRREKERQRDATHARRSNSNHRGKPTPPVQDLIPVGVLVRLLKQVPSVAPQILEEILEDPRVMNPNAYPLPSRAALGESWIRATSKTVLEWEHYNHLSNPTPLWHKYFTPRSHGDDGEEEFDVKVKVARVGDLHSNAMLRVLSELPQGQTAALGTPVAGGLIAVSWQCGVLRRYVFDMAQECFLLLALALWVCGFLQSPTWCATCSSLLTAMIVRETARIILSAVAGFGRFIDSPQDLLSLFSTRVAFGFMSIACLVGLAESAPLSCGSVDLGACEASVGSPFLALSTLCWLLRFLHRLRAFSWFGTHHLSMAQSFQEVWKMVLVLAVMFAGFVMVFRAKCGRDQVSWHALQVHTFKLLLMGDGGAFDEFQSQCGTGITVWLALGVLVFSVCILNQFVAIFNEGYSAAEKAWFTTFLQERAKICHAYTTRLYPVLASLRLPRGMLLLAVAAWDLSNIGVLALKRCFVGSVPMSLWLQPWAIFDQLVPVVLFLLTWRVDWEIGELAALGDPDRVCAQFLQLILRRPAAGEAPKQPESPTRNLLRHRTSTTFMRSQSMDLWRRSRSQTSDLSTASDKSIGSQSASTSAFATDPKLGTVQEAAEVEMRSTTSLLVEGTTMCIALLLGLTVGVDSIHPEGASPTLAYVGLSLIGLVYLVALGLGGAASLCMFWHVWLPAFIATLDMLPRFVRAYIAVCRSSKGKSMPRAGEVLAGLQSTMTKMATLSHASTQSSSSDLTEVEEGGSQKPRYLWVCYRTDYGLLQLGEESAREQAQREERRIFERRVEGMVGQVADLTEAMASLREQVEQLGNQVSDLHIHSLADVVPPEQSFLNRAQSVPVPGMGVAGLPKTFTVG